MHVRTLGGLGLATGAPVRRKPLLVLTYLAVEGTQPRRHVAELFWRDAKDPAASLRVALSQLRAVDDGLVRSEQGRIGTAVRTDAHELVDGLERGETERLDLYEGPLLHGVDGRGVGPQLEEWIVATREYVAARIRHSTLVLAEQRVRDGDPSGARELVERMVNLAPLEELDPERLPRVHALLERTDSPLKDRVASLARDYDLALVRTAPATLSGQRPEALDLDGSAGVAPSHNLPVPLASLVGRDRDLREAAEALENEDCRLLTIHGQGGVGKSRLALQIAYEQLRVGSGYTGVYFVELDALTHARQVPAAIAGALQLRPLATDAPWRELAERVGESRLLLVLDNFEHLTKEAVHLNAFLRGAPRSTVLVTSRERLNLEAEWVASLSGLPIPPDGAALEAAREVGAVKLFVQRAKRQDLGFALDEHGMPHVLKICRRVEGLPLGIELAAAALRCSDLPTLADSLEDGAMLGNGPQDVAPRHRSLDATLAHSWRLLSSEEKRVLRRLAVFQGGFKRGAAAAVAGATIANLMSLVNKSLLRAHPGGRFDRHVLVHEFTRAQLAHHPEEERIARERHGRYYARLLAEMRSGSKDAALDTFFALVEEEESNLLACLTWAAVARNADVIDLLAEPLMWYFWTRGRIRDGEAAFAQAIEALTSTDEESMRGLANLAVGQAYFARYGGDLEQARRLAHRAVFVARTAGAPRELMRALDILGEVEQFEGDHAKAVVHLEEALRLAREQENALQTSLTLRNLSRALSLAGRYAQADTYARKAVGVYQRDLKHRSDVGHVAVQTLGVVSYCQGDWSGARETFTRSVSIAESGGHHGMTSVTRALLADTLFEIGSTTGVANAVASARHYCDEVQAIVDVSGESMGRGLLLAMRSRLALHDGDAAMAERRAREAVGIIWSSHNPTMFFWVLPWLAVAYLARGRLARAGRLVGLMRRHRSAPAWVRSRAKSLGARAAAAFGEDAFDRQFRQGRALSLDVAMHELVRLAG